MREHSWGFRSERSAHDAVGPHAGTWRKAKNGSWTSTWRASRPSQPRPPDAPAGTADQRQADHEAHRAILRAPMNEGDVRHIRRSRGTPQGGPLSPLLANLYLDALDRELDSAACRSALRRRDCRVRGQRTGRKRVLERLTRWLDTHLDLEVNAAKSGARRPGERLLGFRIDPGGHVSPAPKAIERSRIGCANSGSPAKPNQRTIARTVAASHRMVKLLRLRQLVPRVHVFRDGSAGTCANASGCAGTIATDGATRCGASACADVRSGWPAVGAVPGAWRAIPS